MKKRVLVVEDDDLIVKSLQVVLSSEGFEVLSAKNGVQGIVIALKEHPDLILLDILMPIMDGWEMLKQLRGDSDWGKCVPVVILTNLSGDDDEQMRHIAELDPSFFMVKADWKVEGVADKVREILSAPKVPCP